MYGSDKVLLNLAQAMSEGGEFVPLVVLHEDGPLRTALAAAGVEVHVATVLKITRAMLTPAAPFVLLRQARAACRDLDRIVAGRTVALVHSNTLAVLGGAVWACRRRRPHLWHVHEIILKPAAMKRALPWLAERLSARVISNSSATEAWLLTQAPRLAGRSTVVFNGLPPLPPPRPSDAASMRQRIGAADGDVLATVAGRLNHWKGQGLLIDALALLQREGRLGRLRVAVVGDVFAGHEDIRARLVAQVEALQLSETVRFVAFVDDIYAVWRASQIAVVPSTEPEPFGMVAIEAMACGLPVVAAGHGGLLDIVGHEETGLLFEPRSVRALADALARLAGEPELRMRLGQAGQRRQQEHLSMQRQIERTGDIYRQMVAL